MGDKANIGSFSSDPSKGRKPLGRPAGIPNKNTAIVKGTFIAVFQALQTDPAYAEYSLLQWAQKEPTEFYKIASKLFPIEVEAKIRQVITVKILDDDEYGEEDNDDINTEDIEDAEFVDYEDINLDDII